MSADEFAALYAAVAAKTAGWDDALIAAWPCLVTNKLLINLLHLAA